MKNRSRKLFLLTSCFALSIGFLCYSCSNKEFHITKEELQSVFEDSVYEEEFISKWELQNCYQDSFVKRFCAEDQSIVYESVRGELIIAIENIPFRNFDLFIDELRTSFDYEELINDDHFKEYIKEVNLKFAERFYDDKYDIIVVKTEEDDSRNTVITVARTIKSRLAD